MGWYVCWLISSGIVIYSVMAWFPLSTCILGWVILALLGGIVYLMHDFRVW